MLLGLSGIYAPDFNLIELWEKCAWFNSLSTMGLLMTFANSLDPDQARQNVGPDLDPNWLTIWRYSWKIFKKTDLKKSKDDKEACTIAK